MIERAFLNFSVAKLDQYLQRIEACLEVLTEDEVWARGHATENSVGNLCLHLAGNARQWIVSGVGGEPDVRDRDSEFAAQTGKSRSDMIASLRNTLEAARRVIAALTTKRLLEEVTIQGYRQTVLEVVYHVVEHFAGHTGQIIFATKAIRGEDLGFYRHLAQTTHGEATP